MLIDFALAVPHAPVSVLEPNQAKLLYSITVPYEADGSQYRKVAV